MHERLYRSLYRIRRVEEEVARVYPTDVIKSPVHLSIGQESVSVGVCEALSPEDVVFGSYRSHAYYLAKGGDLPAMIAELYGKATGCAKGKGGSMHLVDIAHGVMGASAVVGTTIANAIGYAYAVKLRAAAGKAAPGAQAVVCFFGDGATDEGVFHESLNFAALKELPLIFVCENNLYAIHTHVKQRQKGFDLVARVRSYGIEAERIDGGDVYRIHERVAAARRALREGRPGPFFFECMTYRWKEHVGPGEDYQLGFRDRSEAEPWMASDQVRRVAELVEAGARTRIEAEVEAEIAAAFAFAVSSPFPAPEALYADMTGDR
jgi:TPP-dependent pyruvate/acetoin dehydrogenase alpha subunit